MFWELDELYKVTLYWVALFVSHLTVIIIQLVHQTPVFVVTDANNHNTQGQSSTFHEQIFDFFNVMNDSVCEYQQNHVLFHVLFHDPADVHGFSE